MEQEKKRTSWSADEVAIATMEDKQVQKGMGTAHLIFRQRSDVSVTDGKVSIISTEMEGR